MAGSRKLLVAAAAISTAAGVGFIMQRENAQMAQPLELRPAAPVTETILSGDPSGRGDLELSGIILTAAVDDKPSRDVPTLPRALAAPTAAPSLMGMASDSLDDVPANDVGEGECQMHLDADPKAAAMVHLTLTAECAPYERITFTHQGLTFSEKTDDMGRIEIDVPALHVNARFVASMQNGQAAAALAQMDSLDFYDRVVLQWTGRTDLSIHALEYGAGYGDDGHVWAGQTRDAASAARGEGGFMVQLGDMSLPEAGFAQIYTFPTATARTMGDVILSVEAEVTIANCEREVSAVTTHISGGKESSRRELVMQMPDCDAVGDYLVLKTLVNDLTIASN